MAQTPKKLKANLPLGKYRLRRRLGDGGYGEVWEAYDNIEGISVALKVPFPQFTDDESLETFRDEARIQAALDHPHILKIKSAEFIDGHFVIACDLGKGTLARLCRRALPLKRSLVYFRQALDALAYAHEQKVLHRDIKAENFIFFKNQHLRLGDFGISKILAAKKHTSTIAGTLGHMAPEQAYGRPSPAADVFSLGLLLYRMLSGRDADWPFTWPFRGYAIFAKKAPPGLEHFIRKACAFSPNKRFKNAMEMKAAFLTIDQKISRESTRQKSRAAKSPSRKRRAPQWQKLRQREFKKRYGKKIGLRDECSRCRGPLTESMRYCPWCHNQRLQFEKTTAYPDTCAHCHRGLKKEWRYCPWCFGPQFKTFDLKVREDARYTARCPNQRCAVGKIMPFMRYCPWCNHKIKKAWPLPATKERCPNCRWGIAGTFWDYCSWCGEGLK